MDDENAICSKSIDSDFTVSTKQNDLFDDDMDISYNVIEIKRLQKNKGWKIIDGKKVKIILDASMFSIEEIGKLQKVSGVSLLLSLYKQGDLSIQNIRLKLGEI